MIALSTAPRPEDQAAGPEANPLVNVSEHLRVFAKLQPHARAAIAPGPRDASGKRAYRHLTFAELDRAIDRYAHGLTALGMKPGTRCLFLVKPSLEFFSLTFALFRIGAVPVMLDPGMGRKRVLGAIREVEPEALIAVPRGHMARRLFPSAFSAVKIAVTTGARFPFGGTTLAELEALGPTTEFRTAGTRARDTAAILFTSGSTGAPKGTIYTMGIFEEQVRIFREELGIRAGEVDLSAFPLFSLFSIALGVTCAIPDMDASRPGAVDPRLIVEAVRDLGVTYSFGSPAYWARIAEHCDRERIQLGSVQRILMAGAPAPVSLLERLVHIVPKDSDVYTPYGATECLPISMPSARAILGGPSKMTTEGAGTFVGRPLGRTRVRIIAIDDGPIPELSRARILPAGEIGEIAVSGPVTTQSYFRRPADDESSKMLDGATIWHRMGDVGWLDADGALWFCGRKAHRVEAEQGTMFSECCEAIYNRHPRVLRSALVGLGDRGKQRPVIIVELKPGSEPRGRRDREELREELYRLGHTSPLTRSISDILFHRAFPVDPRHNAKIIREELAVWAAKEITAS